MGTTVKAKDYSRASARIEHSRHKLLRVRQEVRSEKEIRHCLEESDRQLKMALHLLDGLAGEQLRKELRG